MSAVGFSSHWNLLNISAFCLPCCLGLLPGGCFLGREMNRIPHALAMQAKNTQHSQPEELAMLAILLFLQKKTGIVGNRSAPTSWLCWGRSKYLQAPSKMMTVSAFGASGLWNLMNVSAFRATDRRHLMNVLSFGASALWKLMNLSAFRTSGRWRLMNVSAVGFSGHWNLLNV